MAHEDSEATEMHLLHKDGHWWRLGPAFRRVEEEASAWADHKLEGVRAFDREWILS